LEISLKAVFSTLLSRQEVLSDEYHCSGKLNCKERDNIYVSMHDISGNQTIILDKFSFQLFHKYNSKFHPGFNKYVEVLSKKEASSFYG